MDKAANVRNMSVIAHGKFSSLVMDSSTLSNFYGE